MKLYILYNEKRFIPDISIINKFLYRDINGEELMLNVVNENNITTSLYHYSRDEERSVLFIFADRPTKNGKDLFNPRFPTPEEYNSIKSEYPEYFI